MEWISVDDRLPEVIGVDGLHPATDFVLTYDGDEIDLCVYMNNGSGFQWYAAYSGSLMRCFTPTHWMPLPSPPPRNKQRSEAV